MVLLRSINSPQQFINTSNFQARFFTNFGCIEDGFNPKDYLFSASPMANASVDNADVSIKKWFKEISNQSTLSSCVGNGVADAFEAQFAHRNNLDPNKVDNISRLFIYWNSRNNDTPPCANVDKGTRIRLAFDCMARYGAPSEDLYPYDIAKVNERPTILAYREAIKHRISAFYRIDKTGDDRIIQIIQALNAGNPIVFGTALGTSFRYINSDAIVNLPNDAIIGRHCMIIVSWSSSRQAFEIRNSWGEGWGVGGYCWMSPSYLTASITSDLWVPTI